MPEIPITIRAIDEFTGTFNTVINVFQRFESIAMRVDVSQLRLGNAQDRVANATDKVTEAASKLSDAQETLTDLTSDAESAWDDYAAACERSGINSDEATAALKRAQEADKAVERATKDLTAAQKLATSAQSALDISTRSMEVSTLRANQAQKDGNLLMIQAAVNVIPQMITQFSMASMAMGPFGIALAAFGLAAGGMITAVTQNWYGLGDAWNTVYNEKIAPRIADIGSGITDLWNTKISPFITNISTNLGPAFEAAWKRLDQILSILGHIATFLVTTFIEAFTRTFTGIKAIFDSSIGQAILGFLDKVWDLLNNITGALASLDFSKIAGTNVITPTPGSILTPATLPGAMTSGAGDVAVKNAALLAGTIAGGMVGAGLVSTYGGLAGAAGVLEHYSLTGATTTIGARTLAGGILGGALAGGYVGQQAVPVVNIEINSLSEVNTDTARVVAAAVARELALGPMARGH